MTSVGKYVIWKDKAPFVRLDENRYIHLFPVTKYQFERYLWSAAPKNIDYNKMLKIDPRISPHEMTKKNMQNIFTIGLSLSEAVEYANWVGGRLPSINEAETIEGVIASITMAEVLEFTKNARKLDLRLRSLVAKLEDDYIDLREFFCYVNLKEMYTGSVHINSDGPFQGKVWVKKLNENHLVKLASYIPSEYRGPYGFRIIIMNSTETPAS
jgi:hypothetical protein